MTETILTSIFAITFAFAMMYFRFGPGVRYFKKKSHHYIVPPSGEDDPNWVPVDFNDYTKFMLMEWTTSEIDKDQLEGLLKSEHPEIKLKITSFDNWYEVIIDHIDFQAYHNIVRLAQIINGENAFGFCRHISFSKLDFIVKLEIEDNIDHLIGVFRTNQNFGIYLPHAGENPKGNISKSVTKEVDFEYEISKIPTEMKNRLTLQEIR